MKKQLLLALASVFMVCQSQAQTDKLWTSFKGDKKIEFSRVAQSPVFPTDFKLFNLDHSALKRTLLSAPDRYSGAANGVVISIPNAEGKIEHFKMYEASNFDAELQAQFPNIRSYVGVGVEDKYAQVRLSISPEGISSMTFRGDKETEYIEPYSADGSTYAVFNSARSKGGLPFTCSTIDTKLADDLSGKTPGLARSGSGVLLNFRLALSCTGEYAAYHGGTLPTVVAAFNNTMTRVNGVFEKDLAIHMTLVATNANVIYLNAGTDPYGATDANYNAELQAALTAQIGEANYDVGHLVSATGGITGNGNAGCIGCVCVNGQKGSGFTTRSIPVGDDFDIDFVAHEIGHQFGGNHTFSHGNEGYGVNVEVGSGVTIMGYAGITPYDTHPHSIDVFHAANIAQIQANMVSKACPTQTVLTHGVPVPNAGADVTIPMSTPFVLTGSGTDPNGDALNFTWEQNNDGAGQTAANSNARANKPTGPNWVNYIPTTNGIRYFPRMSTVLANQVTSPGLDVASEALSSVARTLTFRLTARDNNILGGQTGFDDKIVTIDATRGPLTVTSQTVANQSWIQGSTQNITWTVNNTNSSTGGANVDILLSLDGGLTFPTVLLAATPNDGAQTITVPNVLSTNARIMIRASAGIFFNVNTTPILIGYTATTSCDTYTNNTPLAVPDNMPGSPVTNTISVPATGTLSDVNIGLNVQHSYPQDLNIRIIHPDATPDVVWANACAGNNDFNVTLSDGSPVFTCVAAMNGTFSPSNPLSVFNNKPSNGTWTLSVYDNANVDTGSILSWSVAVCRSVYTLSNSEFEFEDFALYPNPNNGDFTVKFNSTSTNDIKINIHDMRGRQVYEKSFSNTGAFNQKVNLDQVQSGIYLVSIIDGAKKTVKRIVVE